MKMIQMVIRRVSRVGVSPQTRSATRRASQAKPSIAIGRSRELFQLLK